MKRVTPLLLLILVLAPLASGCGNPAAPNSGYSYRLAPLVQMPPDVQQAPFKVREAYQFAAYNPQVLAELPCYCGCVAMGHLSNYSCYVQQVDQAGEIVYDNHAIACAICVDISQDAMHMLDEGHSVDEIYDHVVTTYSPFGPATPLQ